jgi:hypothetical protein
MAITDYKDTHTGERVFIAGNGPSMEETPLSFLEDEYSIAMNRIGPLLNSTSWQPTYYIQVNTPPYSDRRIERIIDFNSRGISSFIHQDGKSQLRGDLGNEDICEYVNIEYRSESNPRDYINDAENRNYESFWSYDIAEKAYLWETSLYTATQIAVYMGFDEIYFIGCDLYPEFKPVPYSLFDDGSDPVDYIRKENSKENLHRFIFDGGHPIKSFINGAWFRLLHRPPIINILYKIYKYFGSVPETHFEGGDPSIDRFYQAGTNRSLINIHRLISIIGKYEGFACYNATVGGHLEVHERVDLRDIV